MGNELLNQKKIKFGVFEAALATLLFVIFNVVFIEGYRTIIINYGVSSLGILVAQFLVEALFGLAAVVVAYFCRNNIIKAAGLDKKISVYMIVYAILIALCSLVFFVRLTASFLELLSLIGYKSSSSAMDVDTFGKYIGYVIAACVTPAICEELLFRGVIQSGLKKYGKWISIISASLIFMLMHGGPEQTVHQFIVGIIVGLIFYETGNLWLSIMVHFFNNFLSITELFIYNIMLKPSNDAIIEGSAEVVELTTTEAWASFSINFTIALVMAIIGFFAIRGLIKLMVKENKLITKNESNITNSQTVIVDGSEESLVQNQNESNVVAEEDKKHMDAKTIVCFTIGIAWLVFEWIVAFIGGIMI